MKRTHPAPGRETHRAFERGFTLLEVMVAVAIFAFGAIAVLSIRSNSLKEAAQADSLNLVRYLLQRKMEEVLMDPREFEDGDTGEFEEEELRRYVWEVAMEKVNLIGGEDEEDEEEAGRVKKVDIEGHDDAEGGESATGDEEEDEEQKEVVYRVTVYILYPTKKGEKRISATTYIPADAVEDDELF